MNMCKSENYILATQLSLPKKNVQNQSQIYIRLELYQSMVLLRDLKLFGPICCSAAKPRDLIDPSTQGAFNNYINKRGRGGRGSKNIFFVQTQGIKTVHSVKWQNSVHVVVECLPIKGCHIAINSRCLGGMIELKGFQILVYGLPWFLKQ